MNFSARSLVEVKVACKIGVAFFAFPAVFYLQYGECVPYSVGSRLIIISSTPREYVLYVEILVAFTYERLSRGHSISIRYCIIYAEIILMMVQCFGQAMDKNYWSSRC